MCVDFFLNMQNRSSCSKELGPLHTVRGKMKTIRQPMITKHQSSGVQAIYSTALISMPSLWYESPLEILLPSLGYNPASCRLFPLLLFISLPGSGPSSSTLLNKSEDIYQGLHEVPCSVQGRWEFKTVTSQVFHPVKLTSLVGKIKPAHTKFLMNTI